MARIRHTNLMHRSLDGSDWDAKDVPLVDAGGYYASDEVEGALQEIGAGGGLVVITWMETPTGAVNDINDTFVLANPPTGAGGGNLMLFKNGLLQRPGAGNDFTLAYATITFEAGNIPTTGDIIAATYPH